MHQCTALGIQIANCDVQMIITGAGTKPLHVGLTVMVEDHDGCMLICSLVLEWMSQFPYFLLGGIGSVWL